MKLNFQDNLKKTLKAAGQVAECSAAPNVSKRPEEKF